MQSEPVLIVGAILATFPGLVAAAHLLPGQWGQLAAAILTALSGGLIFYVRSKVTAVQGEKKPPSVPPAALGLLAFLLASCAYQAPITSVAEAACVAIADAEFPAAEPFCVFGDELAIAIEDYIASHGGTAPAVQTSPTTGKTTVPHDLYDALARRPGIKGRTLAKTPTCKPAQGQVSP